jgi:hypothetical protein
MDGKLYEVPAALFAEFGLRLGGATKRCYRCDDEGAVLVPVKQIRGPIIGPGKRGLDEQRLRSILSGIALDVAMPAVPVYPEPDGDTVLLDGAHRFAVSLAYGFRELPCQPLTRDQAEGSYGYPWGQS